MAKRIFSGAQPTGNLHIGNYLGALRNWVTLQHEYESFFCVVDLHAITVPQDPKQLMAKTREVARIYLAAGVDPQVSTIFIQSDVKEHAELAWVLNCVVRTSELERMTQYKDKSKKQRENVSVGLLTYPALMAADILLYQTDLVPVGQDQKQHLELTRDLAERFNRDFGMTFKVPDAFIPKVGAKIMALDDPTKKMSKSDENVNGRISLMDDADTIRRKFKRAVTDSGSEIRFDETRPAVTNLLTIYQLLTNQTREAIEEHFAGKGYAHLKDDLAEATIDFLRPFQKRVHGISDKELDLILSDGARKAETFAADTMARVVDSTGLGEGSIRYFTESELDELPPGTNVWIIVNKAFPKDTMPFPKNEKSEEAVWAFLMRGEAERLVKLLKAYAPAFKDIELAVEHESLQSLREGAKESVNIDLCVLPPGAAAEFFSRQERLYRSGAA
ncbi:MAG TPA: tryptophan--tRNA ligase [Pyrinomonadaceae bacterium]|jgi:tryptophanyl-tRNA synthetase